MKRIVFVAFLVLACIVGLIVFPNVHAQTTSSITLAWNPNPANTSVNGYNLYWGTASRTYGAPTNVGQNLAYTLTGLPLVGPLYFAVTDYDNVAAPALLDESGFSTELVCYSYNATSDANSSINPSGSYWLAAGSSQTFTITPKAGFASILNVDGALIGLVPSGGYTPQNISANHTISVVSMAQLQPPLNLKVSTTSPSAGGF